jgi:hypothetical protein
MYLGSIGFCRDHDESAAWRHACDRKGNHRWTTVSQSKLKTYLLVPQGCGGVHVLVPGVGQFCLFWWLGFRVPDVA